MSQLGRRAFFKGLGAVVAATGARTAAGEAAPPDPVTTPTPTLPPVPLPDPPVAAMQPEVGEVSSLAAPNTMAVWDSPIAQCSGGSVINSAGVTKEFVRPGAETEDR